MKLLRNPIVVAILAVTAVVVVITQTFDVKGMWRKMSKAEKIELGSAPAQPVAAPAPAPAVKQGTVTTIPPVTFTNLSAALMPSKGVETAAVEAQFAGWVSVPLRDPFLLIKHTDAADLVDLVDTNSPVRTWTLYGIWNQTDSRIAVINKKVYRPGDAVTNDYKVLRIEKDEVWIQGPKINERLGFPDRSKPAAVAAKR